VVCSGVLILNNKGNKPVSKYRVPFINSRYILLPLLAIIFTFHIRYNQDYWKGFFSFNTGGSVLIFLMDKIPMFLFIVASVLLGWFSLKRKISLIPVLGLLSCLFLMTKLGHSNWLRFLIWLGTGLLIYFLYSRHHSKLTSTFKK
jgi:hypothetical protein